MPIISAKYIEETIIEVEESVTKFVPDDMANADRQALAVWEAEGNEITPLPATKPAPDELRRPAAKPAPQGRHTAPKPAARRRR